MLSMWLSQALRMTGSLSSALLSLHLPQQLADRGGGLLSSRTDHWGSTPEGGRVVPIPIHFA